MGFHGQAWGLLCNH